MKHAREDFAPIQDPRGKIPADEPVFLILGRDALGPRVLRYYAALARESGCSAELVRLVEGQAEAMEAWPKSKLPDL